LILIFLWSFKIKNPPS